VHGWPAAGRQQRRARAYQQGFAGAHIEQIDASEPAAVRRWNQIERAVVFQTPCLAPPDLLGKPVDDLNAGEIALVHGPVKCLTSKRLLMHGSVGVAVEEATNVVLEFADTHWRLRYKRPGELLIVEPRAAFDRVHEVALDRIILGDCDVVTTLHHA